MKILAIDLGKARTGIAMCDKDEILAYPVTVISEKKIKTLVDKVSSVVNDNKPELIVMGLPKNMDNTEGDSARFVREFAELLQSKVECNIVFSDERMSTMVAHNYLNETSNKGKKRKKVIDAVAAVVILQSFLDERKNKRS